MKRNALLKVLPAAAFGLLAAMFLLLNQSEHAKVMLLASTVCVILTFSFNRREKAFSHVSSLPAGRNRPVESPITFADIAANESALSHLRLLADYLAHPEKYAALGARLPRGVLLYGPPGTGKTLMARALAGEAKVPFYSLSGSDFVEMYAGVGASRVRELFNRASKAGKCVIFIDEIDAIGKKRDEGGNSDERDRTLNALLSEMSGFAPNSGVIVLAATNRLDTLDPALTRPGRFDMKIEVGLPDKNERLAILRLHCRKKPMAEDVDLIRWAADTVQFSGASLESLINNAAMRAARRGSDVIAHEDIQSAFVTAIAGDDRPIAATREELSIIALHEAGHAVASHILLPENRIERISILPAASGAGGYNLTIPKESALPDFKSLTAQIQILLAGRAAEQLLNGASNPTAGASGDLSRAGEMAACLVMDLAMTGHPAVSLRTLAKAAGGSPQESAALTARLLEDCYQAVSSLLSCHRELILMLTERLLENETMDGPSIDAFFSQASSE